MASTAVQDKPARTRRAPNRRSAKNEQDHDTKTTRKNGDGNRNANGRSNGRTGRNESSTATLLGVAAAGAALGVAAMIGRKAAVQAPTTLAGDWDKALAAEHAAVLKVFDALQMTTLANTTKRAMLLANLKHMLGKHAFQEENVVYPALRDAGFTEEADELNREHGYVKQYLYELTNCPKDSDRFLDILAKFRAEIESHVNDEEGTLYPALKGKMTEEQNAMVTKAMNKEGFKLA